MKLRFDYNYMMHDVIPGQGIRASEFKKNAALMDRAFESVVSKRGQGWQEWTELPFNQDEVVADIKETAKKYRKFGNFVVFGIGGSALGPDAVATALLHLRHNDLPASVRKAPKLFVEDNIDPERMNSLLDVIDIEDTVFNIITKSGETSETLSQFQIIYKRLKYALGAKAAERIVVTTTIGKGTLYSIAVSEGFKIFGLGAGVGGRFSVLSPVGLLPFAVVGINIDKLLKGARNMSEACNRRDKNPALVTAFLQFCAMKKGKNISVMMPYADSLRYMSDFFCQLWAESLGKALDNSGKTVNVGQTPVKALGVTDQHSQIQLYTEGPFDKVVTFIAVDKFRSEAVIPAMYSKTSFLDEIPMSKLINAEREATEFALYKARRLNFTIYLPMVNEETIGELLQYFMYETAFCGALMDVDTFNQPGVEEGKLATFAKLLRPGYEAKLVEMESVKRKKKYII